MTLGRASLRLLTLLPLPLLAVACASPRAREPRATPGEMVFHSAQAAFDKRQFGEARTAFETYLQRWPQSDRAAEAHLYAGIAAEKEGSDTVARAHLEAATLHGAPPRVMARADLELGTRDLTREDFTRAAGRFRAARDGAVDPETRAEASLYLGIAMQKQGRFAQATRLLRACADDTRFPELAQRAHYRLLLDPYFTVQVGAFADQKNARELVDTLAAQGIPATILPPSPGSRSPYYLVTSGRFSERREAAERRDRIARIIGGEPPLVLP